MYKAHSKDINRNKSFHPLTFANLSRVERLQAEDAAKKEEQTRRAEELQRDKDELRYNELMYAGGGSSSGGAGSAAAGLLPVKRIFAAEYERDAKESTAGGSATSTAAPSAVGTTGATASPGERKLTGFLSKFHSETAGVGAVKRARDDDDNGDNTGGPGERGKAEDEAVAPPGTCKGSGPQPVVTGYVSTSEAARLRKEHEMLKKHKLDPLRRVEEYENRTVAAAARLREAQQQKEGGSGGGGATASEESAIRERIRKIMEMNKKV